MRKKYMKEYDVTVYENGAVTREGKTLYQSFGGHGYPRVWCMRPNGTKGSVMVHRLVALAFHPNPENKPYVNHIDGNPANPKAENLEWCTHSENMLHFQRMRQEKLGMSSEYYNKYIA